MAPAGTLFAGLIFTTTKNLDRETQAKYEIVVEARDAQGLRGESGTATVLVNLQDINDNFPTFTQSELYPRALGGGGVGVVIIQTQ